MPTTDSHLAIGLEGLAPADDADDNERDTADFASSTSRQLPVYGSDSESRTLVGLGPVERDRRSRRGAEAPSISEDSGMPPSEPPGSFVTDDQTEDAELRRALRRQPIWPWAVALSGAALVTGIAVMAGGGSVKRSPDDHVAAAAPGLPANAGLVVKLEGVSARVFVDGIDRGMPPVRLSGLEPGPHVVSITDSAFEPHTQTVTLSAGRVSTVEPALTFIRGTIQLSSGEGADDALVEIVGASERREIRGLPARFEVLSGHYRIRSTREGFAPFERPVVLSAASPLVEIEVVLRETAKSSKSGDDTQSPKAIARNVTPAPVQRLGGSATLGSITLTSIPPSNVVLDGRPLGKSPQTVEVTPGPHTVVFIHPDFGRQSRSVTVSAGRTANMSVEFEPTKP